MQLGEERRRRVKHFNDPGHAHLLTFSSHRRLPLLREAATAALLSESIDRATERHHFSLIAFVYMPEHVHLLVYPERDGCRVERLLYAIKKPFSERVKRHFSRLASPWLAELTVHGRGGKRGFRFWLRGPGHDRNIRASKDLLPVADYLHLNPVRRGLVPSPDLWKWSSWRFYHQPDSPATPGLPRIDGFPD